MRYGEDAIAFAKHQRAIDSGAWGNLCKAFCRESFDVEPSVFGSASAAWYGCDAQYRHETTNGDEAPRGRIFLWTGGSEGFGHAVVTLGGGVCLTNDWRQFGHIDFARINAITQAWSSLTPRGWVDQMDAQVIVRSLVVQPASLAVPKVYVSKLHYGQRNSDSVRSLQRRFGLIVTGNYGGATRDRVRTWQRHQGGTPDDGSHLTEGQARKIFGDHYQIIA